MVRRAPPFDAGTLPKLTRANSAIKEDGDSTADTRVLSGALTCCIFPHAEGDITVSSASRPTRSIAFTEP